MKFPRTKLKSCGLIALAVIFLVGLLLVPAVGNEGGNTLVILHVNDAHGELQNFDKVSWYKSKLEEEYDDVLLVGAGDIFTGEPVVDEYVIDGEDLRGKPMIDVMNAAGFDLSVLGNHEFDYGQERLQANMDEAEFDFILANMDVDPSEAKLAENPPAFAKLKTDFGAQLTFLGLVQIEEKYPSTLPSQLGGLKFFDPVEKAKEYAYLGDEGDAFIGLTHLGYEWDRELAEEVGSFDLIIGGHSATAIDQPELTNGVLIVQAGENLEYLGKVVLTFNERNEVVNRTGELVKVENISGSDSKVKSLIEDYKEDLEKVFSRTINYLNKPIEGTENLGCLMNDAIVESPTLKEMGYDVDVSFQNSGGIRVGRLQAGDVTVGDIYELEPFGNDTIIYEMTTDDIRSLIRNDFDDHGPTDLKVAGLMYEVKINPDNEVEEIKLYDYYGNELAEDKTYQVALNEYIASSYEFSARNDGENTHVAVNDAIITYLDEVIGEFRLNHGYRNLQRTSKSFVGGGKTLAKTEVELSSKGKTEGSTSAGNLMADAIKSVTGVDVATFPSYSGLNSGADSISSGRDVTKPELLTLYGNYIGENKAVVGKIDGKNLEDFLLERGQVYDNVDLQVAGVNIVYTTEDGEITGIETNLEPDKSYTVSFNSYAYGSDYSPVEGFDKDHTTELTEKDMLLDYLKGIDVIGKDCAADRVKLE